MSLRQARQVQEPKVADKPGDLQKPRCHGLKIGLHGTDHASAFVDQAAPASRQALEDVVLLRRRHNFLQHVAGHRQVIAELKQFQVLGGVDPIALGGGRKDLLEARQLQIVDVEELPAPRPDQGIQRPDVAVGAFHGDGNRIGMALDVSLDPGEEIPESRRRMRDLEFLEQAAVRQTDGNTVVPRADIDADTQLQGLGVQHGLLLQQTRPSNHPPVSSTYRATIARGDRHHPGGPVG